MRQLQQDKAELEAKLKQSMDQYREAERIKTEIQNKKTRMAELERNRQDLESDITRVITASVEELEKEIQQFQMTKVTSFKHVKTVFKINYIIFLSFRGNERQS